MIDNRQLLVEAQAIIDDWNTARQEDYKKMYDKLLTILERAIKSAYEHGYQDGVKQHESEGEK